MGHMPLKVSGGARGAGGKSHKHALAHHSVRSAHRQWHRQVGHEAGPFGLLWMQGGQGAYALEGEQGGQGGRRQEA